MDNEKPDFARHSTAFGATGGELSGASVGSRNEYKCHVNSSRSAKLGTNVVQSQQNVNSQKSQFVPSPLQLQVQELEALYKEKVQSEQGANRFDGPSFMFHHDDYHYNLGNAGHYTPELDEIDDSSPPPLFHISSTNEDEEYHCMNAIAQNDSFEKMTDHVVPELSVQNEMSRNSNYFTSNTSSDTLPTTYDPGHHHNQHEEQQKQPMSTYEADHSYEHVYTNFATIDSQHSSVVTSLTSPLTVAALPCFTCCLLKKCGFFCFSCVQLGKFTSSKAPGPLKFTFFEKKYEYLHFQNEKASLNSSIGSMLKNDFAIDILQEKVNQATKRNELLREKLKEAQEKLAEKKSQIIDLTPFKLASSRSMEKKRLKMEYTKNHFMDKIMSKIDSKSQELRQKQAQIKELTWNLAADLRNSIFSIDPYDDLSGDGQYNPSSDLDLRMPLLNCLTSVDVTSTLRPLSTWSNQIKYTIVEPWIYGTVGDLAMYDTWMNEHKDDFSYTNSIMDVTSGNEGGNDALRVTAAFTYLNHMLDAMAKLLDLRLPRKLQLHEFYLGNETSYSGNNYNQMKFRLAKLNVNIIYLCLSQRLDTNLVGTQVRSPLQSLIHLLNPSFDADLGRRGPLSNDAIELVDSTVEQELLSDLALFHEPVYFPNPHDYLDSATDPEDLGFENISFSSIDLFHAANSVSESPSMFGQVNSYLSHAATINSYFTRWLTATTTTTTPTTTGTSSHSTTSPSSSFNS